MQNQNIDISSNTEVNPSARFDDLLALRSLDAVAGIRRVGGKTESYRKQLYRFREHYANSVDELVRLVAEQGVVAGEAYCHGLKGVSANLGANNLFACVAEINLWLKQGKILESSQVAELRLRLHEVLIEIDALPVAVNEPRSAESKVLGKDELLAKLSALAALLNTDLGAAELPLAELRAGAVSELVPVIAEIAAKIDIFAIDEALSLINTLKARLTAAA